MASDWLPWRIHTPQGKRFGHVKVKIDCVSDHVEVSVFHLSTAECHNRVLLVNEFVMHQFRTAHVCHSFGHSWSERAEWISRLLRYRSQFVSVWVANNLTHKIFMNISIQQIANIEKKS